MYTLYPRDSSAHSITSLLLGLVVDDYEKLSRIQDTRSVLFFAYFKQWSQLVLFLSIFLTMLPLPKKISILGRLPAVSRFESKNNKMVIPW